MPGSFYGLSWKDNSGEIGRTEFNIGDLTAVSLPGALTQMGALDTAIQAMILGAKVQSRWAMLIILPQRIPPANCASAG